MPIDTELWNLVQENKAAVIGRCWCSDDPSQGSDDPIYTPEGEWSYARFEKWLASIGVLHGQRLESGQLDIDGDAFRLMYHVPGIEELHALRDSLGVIMRQSFRSGATGATGPSLFPFCTATGRNAHAKSLYNAHASMRSFMVFPAGQNRRLSGLAEAGSGRRRWALRRCKQLIADYRGRRCYHGLGELCGLTDDPDPSGGRSIIRRCGSA